MESSGRVYTPGQAAQVLGVTTQTLRRYAEDYGEVFEPVIQHGRQRVFDDAFVARLQQAQAMQQANTAPSIRVALELVRDGLPLSEVITRPEQPPFEQAVLERLNALAEMVTQLGEENRVLNRRLNELEPPKADIDPGAELEEQRRLNQYLLGELERRRLETERSPARPWWRFWSR
jgi:DNA-binding transcriptional MerR regulator